jgi:pyroglutamyl-peptidase
MKTLLLTGFEPFLKFTVNPTMKIARELHGEIIGGYKIHSEVYLSILRHRAANS